MFPPEIQCNEGKFASNKCMRELTFEGGNFSEEKLNRNQKRVCSYCRENFCFFLLLLYHSLQSLLKPDPVCRGGSVENENEM